MSAHIEIAYTAEAGEPPETVDVLIHFDQSDIMDLFNAGPVSFIDDLIIKALAADKGLFPPAMEKVETRIEAGKMVVSFNLSPAAAEMIGMGGKIGPYISERLCKAIGNGVTWKTKP